MLKLKEIYRNGVIAWSPFELNHKASHMLAIGTAAGSFDIDFNTNNRLEIFSTSNSEPGEFSKVLETETKLGFTTLSWSTSPSHPDLGLIAGGTTDGIVNVYDPSLFRDSEGKPDTGLAATVSMSDKSSISSIDFCPTQPNLLAVGNSHGSVAVTDLTDPSKTTYFDYKQKRISGGSSGGLGGSSALLTGSGDGEDQISCVLWNPRVAPIIATLSATTGTVTIWDMRKKMAIITFNDNSQGRVAAWRGAAWDPLEPTVLATCCDNDTRPVALWDLRSIQVPRYYAGHTRGVSSISWSALEPSLIVTTGRDKTLCWSPATLETRFEIDTTLPCKDPDAPGSDEDGAGPTSAPTSPMSGLLGSPSLLGFVPEPGATPGEQRWDSKALWSPHVPGALALCTFGAHKPKVSVMTVHDPATQVPPMWMKRRAGAAFCAGNMLARFSAKAVPQQQAAHGGAKGSQQQQQAGKSEVFVHRLAADTRLAERAEKFQETLRSGRLRDVCKDKVEGAKDDDERDLWGALGAHFGENVRGELQKVLGYDAEKIAQELTAALAPKKEKEEEEEEEKMADDDDEEAEAEEKKKKEEALFGEEKGAEEDAFTSIASEEKLKEAEEEERRKKAEAEERAKVVAVAAEGEDGVLTRALLLGRFEEAVDYCFQVDRDADALLIASYGSRDQFERARAKYAAKRLTTPEMRFIMLLARTSLPEIVATVALDHWRAALAALCTYAAPDAFPVHAAALGRRLEAAGNMHAAAICFVAAGDAERVVTMWLREQEAGAAAAPEALATLVEDLAVLVHAVAMETAALPEPARAKFVDYAKVLEANGFPAAAAHYVDFLNTPAYSGTPYAIFLDRLYKTAADDSLVLKAVPFNAAPAPAPARQPKKAAQHQAPLSSLLKGPSPAAAPAAKPPMMSSFIPKQSTGPVIPPTTAAVPAPAPAPTSPSKVKLMNIPAIPQATTTTTTTQQQQQHQAPSFMQPAIPKASASAAFMRPAIPAIPSSTPAAPAATTQTYTRPQMSQMGAAPKMFTPGMNTAAAAATTTPAAAAAAPAATHSASALFANAAIPKPVAPAAPAAAAPAGPKRPAQGMFIPKAPAAPVQQQPQQPQQHIPTVAGGMGHAGMPMVPQVPAVPQQSMVYGAPGAGAGNVSSAPQVPQSKSHPATKALTVPLAETVQEKKPADPEKVAYIREIIKSTIPGMERSAAGTQHAAHVKEMINKLTPLEENVDKFDGPVVDALYEVFRVVMEKNWAAADAAFASLIKSHGSQLKQGIPVGLRFFMRLYKMLPQ